MTCPVPADLRVCIMLARICLVASVATASATLELTPENWQAEVTDSGKSAFIK